jgi:hypothetical protein
MTLILPDTLIFEAPVAQPVQPLINEISGIVDSRLNPGFLWAHEDSGNPPNLILLSNRGNVAKRIPIKNAINRDWEDMAIAGDQFYIGDIGDNNQIHSEYVIYQFTEPASSIDSIKNYKTIRFGYADGAHDAEAFIVDPGTRDIYLITKRDNPSRVYKLSYPQSFDAVNTAVYVGALTFPGVVSATLSADAKDIIIKTYTGLHYYQRLGTEELSETLSGSFTELEYKLEPQGEAVAFASDNSGFYTLSEKGLSNVVNLYFYRKK